MGIVLGGRCPGVICPWGQSSFSGKFSGCNYLGAVFLGGITQGIIVRGHLPEGQLSYVGIVWEGGKCLVGNFLEGKYPWWELSGGNCSGGGLSHPPDNFTRNHK